MSSVPAFTHKQPAIARLAFWALLVMCVPIWLAGQDSEDPSAPKEKQNMGTIYLQINQAKPETFLVEEAVLYREVSIRFDTTAILQNDSGFVVYYFPQLHRGTHFVLHVRLQRPAEQKRRGFFDVFYDLGDSLRSPLDIQDSTAVVYFSANGQLLKFKPLAHNFRGHFELVPGEKAKTVSGDFETEFDYPLAPEKTHFAHIRIWGTLSVPSGKLHEVSLETLAYKKQRQKSFRRNVGVALIFIAIIIFFVGS